MGLASKVSKRLDVPGEPGQWIEIRMLAWPTLDKAKRERLTDLGGMAETFAQLRDAVGKNGGVDEAKAAAEDDPFQSYDKGTLLRHGVVAWSYTVDAVDVELLDEATAEWAAREILTYTLPGATEKKEASPAPSVLASGEGYPPEEWSIAELSASWGAPPFRGGILEQPLGLLILGADLRAYASAYATYEQDPKHAPAAIRDLVLLTAKASAEMRQS